MTTLKRETLKKDNYENGKLRKSIQKMKTLKRSIPKRWWIQKKDNSEKGAIGKLQFRKGKTWEITTLKTINKETHTI